MTRFFPMVLNGEPQSSGLLHGTLLESLHRPLKHLTIKWETREAIFGYHLLSTWVEVKNVLLKEPFFTKISLRILNLLYYLPSKFIRHFFFFLPKEGRCSFHFWSKALQNNSSPIVLKTVPSVWRTLRQRSIWARLDSELFLPLPALPIAWMRLQLDQ